MITIVLSTFNGEKYLYELLKSLNNQKRKPDEVLIFDDKSTDETVPLITKFILDNKLVNWKLNINSVNKGWRRNFMEGFQLANGDLIFPCDQDDIWEADKLLEMEKIMLDNPNINVLASNYISFYENGNSKIGPYKNDNKLCKLEVKQAYYNTNFPGCTYCVRKSFVEKAFEYFEENFPHDALLMRLSLFSDSFYRIGKSLIKWRMHSDSTMKNELLQRRTIKYNLSQMNYMINFNKELESFVMNVSNDKIKLDFIKNNYQWIELRKKFYTSRKIFDWLKIYKYKKNYTRLRQWLLDLYIVFFDKC